MKPLHFKVWHFKENKMYYRGYQKFLWVLLCEDDQGVHDGKGSPVKRASYDDCDLLEGTSFIDLKGQEVFEGDIVRVKYKDLVFVDTVRYVPDMFGSKNIHPLESILAKRGIKGYPQNIDVEILGNKYENPELLSEISA